MAYTSCNQGFIGSNLANGSTNRTSDIDTMVDGILNWEAKGFSNIHCNTVQIPPIDNLTMM